MSFKLSKYITVSDPLDQEDTPKSLRMIFSTRKGMGITLTNYIWSMVTAGNFDMLPDHLFNILMFHEMIIPADEDELEEIITRKACMAGDARQQETEVCIGPARVADPAFTDTFGGLLRDMADTAHDAFRKTLKVTVPDAGTGQALRVVQFVDGMIDARGQGGAPDVQYRLVFNDVPDILQARVYEEILPQVTHVVFVLDRWREDSHGLVQALTRANKVAAAPAWQAIAVEVQVPWTNDALFLQDLAAPLKSLAEHKHVRIYPMVAADRRGDEHALLRYLRRLELHLNLLPGNSCSYLRRGGQEVRPDVRTYTGESLLFDVPHAAGPVGRHLYDETIVEQLRMHAIACATCIYLPMCGGQTDKDPGDDSCPAFVHNFGEKIRLKYALAPGLL